MNLGTILVHLDHSEHCAVRTGLAATLARQHGSHLIGLIPTGLYDGSIPAAAIAGKGSEFMAASADYLRARAEAVAHVFREQIQGDTPLSFDVRLVEEPSVDSVIRHGRTSDLVVVGQADRKEGDAMTSGSLPEQVVIHSGRPALIVPRKCHSREFAKNVLVGWDGTREAAMALRDSVPLLARAANVVLMSVTKPGETTEASSYLVPQTLAWLERHGVRAKAEEHAAATGITDLLLSGAARIDADLIVIGGYGHARVREIVLGGVTREILDRMSVPLLMAH
ncbi:universal stress protein [Variovorax sp. J22R24]|uniref:universal stress protein n=1 Tax=Variovorax gracilis TaxID=3053502 RepID=UPI0025776891|nr:universal stress protein [Variovorax sp. J22R24]MDM0107737.1 universal stress protein [Variovorax sp. J22R24]